MKVYALSFHSPLFRADVTDIYPRQPVMADEVQTFKALITIHKVLQEGHPITIKEAQANVNWLESLTRGVSGDGLRGASLHWAPERGTQKRETSCRGRALT